MFSVFNIEILQFLTIFHQQKLVDLSQKSQKLSFELQVFNVFSFQIEIFQFQAIFHQQKLFKTFHKTRRNFYFNKFSSPSRLKFVLY